MAVLREGGMGDKIDTPWGEVNELVTLRTQELLIIAGGAGGGKSTLAINWVMAATEPVLYLAQDTPASVKARMIALIGKQKTQDVADALTTPDGRELAAFDAEQIRDTLVLEEGAVSVQRIELLLSSLTEWLGAPPPIVIVDNLIDMKAEGGKTHHDPGFYAQILPELKQMAIKWNVMVVALHHITRSTPGSRDSARRDQGQGNKPIRMTDLYFAGERESRHVWGVHLPDSNQMKVQILKQQDGAADPDGALWVRLRFIPQYSRVVSKYGPEAQV